MPWRARGHQKTYGNGGRWRRRPARPGAKLVTLDPGTILEALVRALNALRASPRDIIAILQGLKPASALQAELTPQVLREMRRSMLSDDDDENGWARTP